MPRSRTPRFTHGRPPGCRGAARERGSVTIMASIFVVTAILLGIALDAGYLFYMRRHLQSVADMAATAGAQALPDYQSVYARVSSSIQQNKFAGEVLSVSECGGLEKDAGTVQVICGQWPDGNAIDQVKGLSDGDTDNNAVQVTVSENVSSFFPGIGSRLIQRTAIAAKTQKPTAMFSVGSGLVRINGNGLLSQLLGLKRADIASYQGLAGISITPAGLLQALGVPVNADLNVGTLADLASVQNLTVGKVLDITKTVIAGQSNTADASVALLSSLEAELTASTLNLPVNLFSDSANNITGIFADIATASDASALNTSVNVLDLVSTALAVANSQHAVQLPLDLGFGLVQVGAMIIEPPSIGIGGVGTTANTAQIRLFLTIDTDQLPLVGKLLSFLGTSVTLPIMIDVAQSQGTLTELCEPDLNANQAKISVRSAISNICIGGFANGTWQSKTNSCATMTLPTPIASILGIPIKGSTVLSLGTTPGASDASGLGANSDPKVLTVGDPPTSYSTQLPLGQSIGSLGGSLLNSLLGNITSQGPGAAVLAVVTNVLNILTAPLNTMIQALLNTLGINLGTTDVSLMSVDCGAGSVQLVY